MNPIETNTSKKLPIQGFSKLSKIEKIEKLISEKYFYSKGKDTLKSFWHSNIKIQKCLDEFSENTISNFPFPYGVVPNLLLDGELLCVPMVIEESSVVAACSKSAKYWLERGGFKTEILGTKKVGQVHFLWEGDYSKLVKLFAEKKNDLLESVSSLVHNMNKRGGGVLDLELIDRTKDEKNYYQIKVNFETCDAMGANFINSILEVFGREWKSIINLEDSFSDLEKEVQIVMCILSNYTPECVVKCWVECDVDDLYEPSHKMTANEFSKKFEMAVKIATIDVHRATTHNKGIFNGIDAVVLATGNDFRAVEACGHAYAARSGQYRSLTNCELKDGKFKFSIEIPLSIGTVGGLTNLHPLADMSLEMMDRPSAKQLMGIIAAIGLAQNFGALSSLITSGIQKGHMKMHLLNILNHLEATNIERDKAKVHFVDKSISFTEVREFLSGIRKYH